jgi:nitroimidazol reductase NimA-like FMN-containing flavoprotein (pyridoxamine 5'-phosphate oxidase superfamily)
LIEEILDRGLVAHIAFVDRGEAVCIPMLYAHLDGRILIHGSRASRAIRHLGRGEPAWVTVTLLQGLVLARSVFEHSANYESVTAFGRFHPITGGAQSITALAAFTNKLLPGRWEEVRAPDEKELKATRIVAMEVEEAAAKVRYGPPDDDHSRDAELEIWAGEIPLVTSFGEPVASPELRPGIAKSPSLAGLCPRLREVYGAEGGNSRSPREARNRVYEAESVAEPGTCNFCGGRGCSRIG